MSVNSIPIPNIVEQSSKNEEILRVWIADNQQIVALSDKLWKDPGVWGIMLVDLARHVALSYKNTGMNPDIVIKKIRYAMDVEWNHPTT
jgi:hypothetical protein